MLYKISNLVDDDNIFVWDYRSKRGHSPSCGQNAGLISSTDMSVSNTDITN